MKKLSLREKSMLAGLYLSKFDTKGLRHLDFESFTVAFNAIGLALGVNPASIKNYRDEFDPLFPNNRKGWRKRPMRDYCKAIYDAFNGLNLNEFAKLLKQIVYKQHDIDVLMEKMAKKEGDKEQTFAKRLITGQAAEQYFKAKYEEIKAFAGLEIEDTTKAGCGFDFRMVLPNSFYGVEVKGMNEIRGNITMTNKEHSVATLLKERYFLFVVKNFKETPFHEIYRNPLNGKLPFNRIEQEIISISWTTNI